MEIDLRTQSTVRYADGRPYKDWRVTDLVDELEARYERAESFDSEIVFELAQRALAAEGAAVAEHG